MMNRGTIAAAILSLTSLVAGCASIDDAASNARGADRDEWARNVILFIGDGMGPSTITAARIYDGQSRGESGEENLLAFERFPNVALVKTYNSNQQVPDSAGTASAMNTGVKTRAGMIGVGPQGLRGDCEGALAHRVPNIAEKLIEQGRAIGIVTTARLTHATPAAVYAHIPERNWENDSAIPDAELAKGCTDAARQLVEFPFTVALGGGRKNFLGKREGGNRRDESIDLMQQWVERTQGVVVKDRTSLQAAVSQDRPVLGVFADMHMTYALDRAPDSSEPALAEMTRAAIARLSRHRAGYFLMVESGRIDHGHHDGRAAYALQEVQELSRAVEAALSLVDLSDTLILVTADHSHVFTMGGYATRGNPILGLVRGNDSRGMPKESPNLADDGQPYTTLGYYNGPGAVTVQPRPAPSNDPKARQQALVPITPEETHGGEDVPLYATGAGSKQVGGVIEQNRIFDIMMNALGMRQTAASGR
jgi:alkaline phosphatase